MKVMETAMSQKPAKLREPIKKIKIEGIHTKKYLNNLKTTYLGQKVVFILPSGKEYK